MAVVVVAGCGRRSGKAHGRITLSRGIDFLILQVVDLEDRLFYFVLLRSFVKSLLGKRRRGLEGVGGENSITTNQNLANNSAKINRTEIHCSYQKRDV